MANEIKELKRAVIVYAHPYEGSFAHAELDMAVKAFQDKNKPVDVIDLNKDQFNPVYTQQELKYYAQGKALDENVKRYQSMLKEADEVVFIYPVWWGTRPAIMQGFFEKVFLSNDFWVPKKLPVIKWPYLWGTTKWIKKVTVLASSSASWPVNKFYLRNASKNTTVSSTLKALRMKGIKYYCTTRISMRSRKYLDKRLRKFYNRISK